MGGATDAIVVRLPFDTQSKGIFLFGGHDEPQTTEKIFWGTNYLFINTFKQFLVFGIQTHLRLK